MMFFDLLLLFDLCALTTLIYLPGLSGQFVLDDNLILKNKRINGRFPGRENPNRSYWYTLTEWWMSRNLTMFSFERDAVCHPIVPENGQVDSWGWHATSLAIHVSNCVLVYGLLRRWFEPMPAFAGALIFAVHPIATGVTSYIAGRSSSLCCFFFLITLLAVATRAWWIVPLGFIGAYASKEEWVALPASAAIIWWFT